MPRVVHFEFSVPNPELAVEFYYAVLDGPFRSCLSRSDTGKSEPVKGRRSKAFRAALFSPRRDRHAFRSPSTWSHSTRLARRWLVAVGP